jgi:hypothetical protein
VLLIESMSASKRKKNKKRKAGNRSLKTARLGGSHAHRTRANTKKEKKEKSSSIKLAEDKQYA